MAVWQFDVQLIPRGAPTPSVGADGIEVEPCWEGFSTEVDIKGRLSKQFGAAREVLPNWFQWGEETGNRIDAGFEGTRLTSLWRAWILELSTIHSFIFCASWQQP